MAALELEKGVVRGPLIGSTFQGTLYDQAGNMDDDRHLHAGLRP